MKYTLQQMQLEKTIGELNALKVIFYDSMAGNSERWVTAKNTIDNIIEELRNNFG